MKWIGLTGGIASGKSVVSKILREQGYPVIDADILARLAIQPDSDGYKAVRSQFGENILDENGGIDREKLAKIVFSDPEKLSQLEAIIHPIIRSLQAQKRRELEQQAVEVAFYDVPLLFEKNLQEQFEHVVLVYSPVELQKQRMKSRDELADEEIEKRLNSQLPIDDKVSLSDFVIQNTGDLSDLKNEVLRVLKELQSE